MPRTRPRAYAGAEAFSTVSLVVDDDRAAAQHREHGRDPGRDDGLLDGGTAVLLAVADVPGEHGAAGDDGPDERGEERLRRRIHSSIVGRRHAAFASAERAASERSPLVHRVTPAGHLAHLRSRPCVRPSTTSSTPIFDDLAGICRRSRSAVACATEALLTGDAEIAERVISADVEIDRARERVEDTAFSLLSLQQPVAGDLRIDRRRAADGQRARADGRPVRARRQDRPAAGAQRRGARGGPADRQPDGRGRRGHGRAGSPRSSPSRDVDGRDRARPRRRGDGPAAPHAASPSCSPTTGRTASRRPSTSPCSAATTSGSPTTPSRSPTGSSSSSPASTRAS